MSTLPNNADGAGKSKFNLSLVALNNRSVIWYFMIVCMVAGAFAYINLGREEDPQFTIKTMVITALWPGASVNDTVNQVTDRIEKKLEELQQLDYTKSDTIPGQTTIYVYLQSKTKGKDVPAVWHECATWCRTFSLNCRKAWSGHSSTTSSATCTATSMRSPPTA